MSFAKRTQTKERNGRGGQAIIVNHHLIVSAARQPSSFINAPGFTLIELLVVISIIALLMAILLPTLRAVRKQGHAVKCQGTLRQWGLYYSMYTAENDYKMPGLYNQMGWWVPGVLPREFFADPLIGKGDSGRMDVIAYGRLLEGRELFLCPATRFQPPQSESIANRSPCQNGTTRLAWSYPSDMVMRPAAGLSGLYGSSYGLNGWISWKPPGDAPKIWTSCLLEGAATVPVYSDCRAARNLPGALDPPPPCDDAVEALASGLGRFVMNRHSGGINSLFMDWSVRKVGLKELWTLKWSPDFDTAGPWTRGGGVKPEDWPAWMRGFKDY